MKYTLQSAVLRLGPAGLIRLVIKGLSAALRFRTPRKLEEFEKLPKHSGSNHPKSGFGAEKDRIKRLGKENGLNSLFHPDWTPGRMTHPRSENRIDLTRFQGVVLQPV